jgi:hypothetical protein
MEATGAIKTCLDSHINHNVVYEYVVMGDDSSSKNILRWNSDAALAAKLIDVYPRIASGRRGKTRLSRFVVGKSRQIRQVSKITKLLD